MTRYELFAGQLTTDQVVGFHTDWAYQISSEKLLRIFRGSETVLLAMDGERVIGYAAVLGDGEAFAYLSSIEVLPEFRGQGIGKELMQQVFERYRDRYALDLLCDEELLKFYQPLGMTAVHGRVSGTTKQVSPQRISIRR